MCNPFFKTFLTFGKSKIRGRAPQGLLSSALFLYRSGSMSRHGLWEMGFGLADGTDRRTKPGREERNKVLHVFRSVRGVATPLRKGLDPVRSGGRIVDCAKHEMKPPEYFVARELG